jgi:hypothetical protein
MKRRFCLGASTFGVTASALILANCSTPQTRISDHLDIYQGLSSRDQALVNQGQIRSAMSQNAVWLAWGSPDRKIVGNMQGHPTESWIYISYAVYPYYPYSYPYYGSYVGFGYGLGYTSVGVATTTHHQHGGRTFVFFGSPFYDPFYYSYIPPSIPYPSKVVSFSSGRVVSFQYLVPP